MPYLGHIWVMGSQIIWSDVGAKTHKINSHGCEEIILSGILEKCNKITSSSYYLLHFVLFNTNNQQIKTDSVIYKQLSFISHKKCTILSKGKENYSQLC